MATTLKDDHNVEIGNTPPVASLEEERQRRRMLVALAVLLAALLVVIIKDRQFWFPPSPESIVADQNSPVTAPSSVPTAVMVPVAPTAPRTPPPHPKAKSVRSRPSPASSGRSPSPTETAVAPVITATSRAVLPPLEVEVVAGNQHRTLAPKNNSVKVEMDSSAPSDTAAPAPTQESNAEVASAQVRMSAPPAERVSRSVKPDYPLLAKQMKVQGAVVLQALIDKAGNIEDLHVVSGPAILSAAAQEAVRQWHFKPYYQGGRAVETEARITVNFTISTY